MPELSDLQEELLRVLKANLEKQEDILVKICKLTSPKIIEKMKIKPAHENYVSKMLKRLQQKGKVKVHSKFIEGEGLVRIIEILD